MVRVETFVFPIDFVVMDMNKKIPIVLGRPILDTVREIINLHSKTLVLRLDMEEVTYKFDESTRLSSITTKHLTYLLLYMCVPQQELTT